MSRFYRITLVSVSIASCFSFTPLSPNTRDDMSPLKSVFATKLQQNDSDSSLSLSSPSKLRSLKFIQLPHRVEPGLLADYLMELGACSVSVTDHDVGTDLESPIFAEPGEGDKVMIGRDLFDKWGEMKSLWMRCDVNAHFSDSFDFLDIIDQVRCSFDLGTTPRFEVDDVLDIDWVKHVQTSWKPFVVGGFVLKFPWHTCSDVKEAIAAFKHENEKEYHELLLEGGIAFGTGEHPTTQLCLEWITQVMKHDESIKLFLDYGSGSGVLGMAACKLKPSALEAVGVEIDVDAIRIADSNAKINNVKMRNYLPFNLGSDNTSASVIMRALHRSDAPTLPDKWNMPLFDACAANILAGPLISLSGTIAGMLRPGAKLGLSGILSWQGDDVVEAYSEFFDNVKIEKVRNGWCLVTGERKLN